MTQTRLAHLSTVLTLGLSCASAPAEAQSVPTITLKGAVGRLKDGFSYIRGIRELSDGRVLIAPAQNPQLSVADYRTGTLVPVGSRGSGPGEYRSISRIQALGGDSTLVLGGDGRWLIFAGTTVVRALPPWTPGRALPRTIVGADRFGRLLDVAAVKYGTQPGVALAEYNQNAESLAVIVLRRSRLDARDVIAGRPDTVARIRGAFRGVRMHKREMHGVTGMQYILYTILDGPDQAVMFPDGWIAVAYTEPYHVAWFAPDGRRTLGAPIPFEQVPVDEVQKLAAVARDGNHALFKPDEYPPWPQTLPAFQDNAVVAMSDGRLAIMRTRDARVKVINYDLVDRTGRLTARLQLADNQELRAITERWVYVSRRDSDNVIWLERYAWPPP